MSELLPITPHWTDELCMAPRKFPTMEAPEPGISGAGKRREPETAALCTRPKGHKGNHKMVAPAFPVITWKRDERDERTRPTRP